MTNKVRRTEAVVRAAGAGAGGRAGQDLEGVVHELAGSVDDGRHGQREEEL